MTPEQIKEKLATYHFAFLASRMGCKILTYDLDDGVDLGIDQPIIREIEGVKRYLSNGTPVEVQLKTTTRKQVVFERKSVIYMLEAKNYNDLVQRRRLRFDIDAAPLILGLFVLEDDPQKWVQVLDTGTMVGGTFYWYFPSLEMELTGSRSKQRIEIPSENKVGLSFFQDVFNLHFQKRN